MSGLKSGRRAASDRRRCCCVLVGRAIGRRRIADLDPSIVRLREAEKLRGELERAVHCLRRMGEWRQQSRDGQLM